MGKLVYGVGVYTKGEHVSAYTYAGRFQHSKEYPIWLDMLRRCYSVKSQAKNPTYVGCSVSDNFKNFQYFAEWCQSQIGFGLPKYQLDKDILIKGNKLYSETTCVFVPRQVNMLLTKSSASRGNQPIGVTFYKDSKKFRAQACIGHKRHLGYFSTQEEAFLAYKEAKEQQIKLTAELYKDSIDPRVYQALLEYAVEMDD